MNSNTNFSCSSWNYGAYSVSNPYFNQANRPSSSQYRQVNIQKVNNYSYNKFGKRILPEEERIVTNDYMSTINHMKKIKEFESKKSKKSIKIRMSKKRKKKKVKKLKMKKMHQNIKLPALKIKKWI